MQKSFGKDMKDAVERTKDKFIVPEKRWYDDDEVEDTIHYIKYRLFDKNKDHFYTPDAIFSRFPMPERMQQSIRQKLQSGAHNQGVKKIHRSVGPPYYGTSDYCSDECIIERKCFKEWCIKKEIKYVNGDVRKVCPRDDGKELVFVDE